MIGGDKGILAAVAGRAAKRRALGLSLSGREGGTVGGGGGPPPPAPSTLYGPIYGNWDGSYINININTSPSTTDNNFSGIDSFYDSVNDRLYDSYAGNNSYSYYNGLVPTVNVPTNLPSRPATSGGRGCTVAYQNESSYILMTNFSGGRIDVWKIETGGAYTYKGTMFTQPSTNGGIAFLNFNNTSYFFTAPNGTTNVYRHLLPDLESLNNSTISLDITYSLPASIGYNFSFLGEDGSGNLYFLYHRTNEITRVVSIAKTASAGTNFTTVAQSALNISGFCSWVDYVTPAIYVGGLTASSTSFWTT